MASKEKADSETKEQDRDHVTQVNQDVYQSNQEQDREPTAELTDSLRRVQINEDQNNQVQLSSGGTLVDVTWPGKETEQANMKIKASINDTLDKNTEKLEMKVTSKLFDESNNFETLRSVIQMLFVEFKALVNEITGGCIEFWIACEDKQQVIKRGDYIRLFLARTLLNVEDDSVLLVNILDVSSATDRKILSSPTKNESGIYDFSLTEIKHKTSVASPLMPLDEDISTEESLDIQTAEKAVKTIGQPKTARLPIAWGIIAILFLGVIIYQSALVVISRFNEAFDTPVNELETLRTTLETENTALKVENQQMEILLPSNKTISKTSNEFEALKHRFKAETEALKFQNQLLETRLGEVMKTAVDDNDDFTKLDEYSSKFKIKTEFKQLYDNEYTRAVIEMQSLGFARHLGTNKLAQYFLGILKMSDNLCRDYSTKHLNSIRQSVTTLPVVVPLDHERLKYSQEPSTLEDEGSTKVKTVNLTIDNKLSKLELSQIFDVKKSAALKFQDPLIKILTDVIAGEYRVQQEEQPQLVKYIKCLLLCWMMNMHLHPVFIDFVEISDSTIFDTDTFKPYLSSGKYIEYVVWPPLYSYTGGNLLVKGIAEGKN